MQGSEKIVIVGYKPFSGKENQLADLLKNHVKILQQEGLSSDRSSIIMKSKNSTFIEIFGWKSKEAMEAAHTNPVVLQMWGEFAKVCEYVPVGDLDESKELFSEFTPVN